MKVGDLVCISSFDPDMFFVDELGEYLYKQTEIMEIKDDYYKLSIDGGKYWWLEKELEFAKIEDLFE